MKVAVVTRHLLGCDKEVSAVIHGMSSPMDQHFNYEDHLRMTAQDYILDFKQKFVEFQNAEWEIVIMETI